MSKIWLKNLDPTKQYCPCESRIGPCSTCCSFSGNSVLVASSTNTYAIKDLYRGLDYSKSTFVETPPSECWISDQIVSSYDTGMTREQAATLTERDINSIYIYSDGPLGTYADFFYNDYISIGQTFLQVGSLSVRDGVNNLSFYNNIIKETEYIFGNGTSQPSTALNYNYHFNINYTFQFLDEEISLTFPTYPLTDTDRCTYEYNYVNTNKVEKINFTVLSGDSLELVSSHIYSRAQIAEFRTVFFLTSYIQEYDDITAGASLSTTLIRESTGTLTNPWVYSDGSDTSYTDQTVSDTVPLFDPIVHDSYSLIFNTFESDPGKVAQLRAACESYWNAPPPYIGVPCSWDFANHCTGGDFATDCCEKRNRVFLNVSDEYTNTYTFLKSECVTLSLVNNDFATLKIRFKRPNGTYYNPFNKIQSLNLRTGLMRNCNELP